MKTIAITAIIAAVSVFGSACRREKGVDDRTQAEEMYARICELTRAYTERLHDAPDTTDWAVLCGEYEEKLDKISLSYPPDTDILLTEGQNDTIYSLMQDYSKARSRRIHGLRFPEDEPDTAVVTDSLTAEEEDMDFTEG